MAEQKSTTVASASSSTSKSGNLNSPFALIVIIACLIVSVLVYKFFLGNGANFEGGNPENHPLPGNFLAIVYKGGFIVPILMSLMMIVITFSIERFLTIMKAKGNGGVAAFVKSVKYHLEAGNLAEAKKACDKQKGSVANVVRAAVDKYEKWKKNRN